MWDEKTKAEIDARIEREMAEDLAFAENSPFPPPELAEQGVYCEGCHTIEAEWQRPKEEVMPPKSSVNGGVDGGGFRRRQPRRRRQHGPGAASTRRKRRGRRQYSGRKSTYLEAIRQALLEEMDRDPAVVLLGEDIGVYGGAFKVTAGLLERFGWERVIDTPISETAIVGAAAGMSYLGLRPVAEMQFIDFIACAFDQITNFVGQVALPLGRAGADGDSRAGGRRRARRTVPFRQSGDVLRAHAGPEGGLPGDGL